MIIDLYKLRDLITSNSIERTIIEPSIERPEWWAIRITIVNDDQNYYLYKLNHSDKKEYGILQTAINLLKREGIPKLEINFANQMEAVQPRLL